MGIWTLIGLIGLPIVVAILFFFGHMVFLMRDEINDSDLAIVLSLTLAFLMVLAGGGHMNLMGWENWFTSLLLSSIYPFGMAIYYGAKLLVTRRRQKQLEKNPEGRLQTMLDRAIAEADDEAGRQVLRNLLSLVSPMRIFHEEIQRLILLAQRLDQSMQDIDFSKNDGGDGYDIRKKRTSIDDRIRHLQGRMREIELFAVKTQANLLCLSLEGDGLDKISEEFTKITKKVQADLRLIKKAKKEADTADQSAEQRIAAVQQTTPARDKKAHGAQVAAQAAHH